MLYLYSVAKHFGFSYHLYLAYSQDEKLQPLVAEISWTKNIIIMERCKDDLEREFYLKIVRRFGWTKDVLLNNPRK